MQWTGSNDENFWTATVDAEYPTQSWNVNGNGGTVNPGNDHQSNSNRVACVP